MFLKSKTLLILSFIIFAISINAQNRFTVNKTIEYRNSDLSKSSYYKMVSLPGDTSIAVSNVLTGNSQNDWMAFYDKGEGYFIPYTNETKSDFTFSAGNAFWIISKYDIKVGPYTVSNVKLNADSCFEITLHTGWNLISNPFNKSINWSAVRTKNNIQNDLIFYFKDGYYDNSSVKMEPYLGYYYYNKKGLDKLLIPYSNSALSKENNFNNLVISLSNNTKTSTAYIITDNIFSFDYDSYDQIAPNNNFVNFGINIINNNFTGIEKNLSIEAIPSINNIAIPIEIINKESEPAYLTIENNLNNNLFFALINSSTGNLLYPVNNQFLIEDNTSISYLLLVGDNNYIAEYINNIPHSFILQQNYPNPFNPTTNISFSIPANTFVTLKIYDVLGREITTLVNDILSAGNYTNSFNAENLSSGIYFYKLEAGGFIQTKKMVLIR